MRLEILPYLRKVVSQQVHHDQVLLTVFDKVLNVAYMFQPLQVLKHVILKDQYALVFVFLLHFQGNVLFKLIIVSLVNEAESSLT